MKKIIIPIIVILILALLGGGFYYLYQYTEVFGKKIIPTKINNITIEYVPGYDIEKAKGNNELDGIEIKIQEIKLDERKASIIKSDLRKITKSDKKTDDFNSKIELLLNDKTVIKINKNEGIINNNSINIPNSLLNDIDAIIDENNEKILKTNSFESIVLKMNGSSITVKNKDNLDYLKNSLLYYPITLPNDFKTFDNGYKIEVILDNQTHIYLYENTNVGYIQQQESSTFAVFDENFKDIINRIHDISVEK